jgi:4'-phosphopantetheinyl transferase
MRQDIYRFRNLGDQKRSIIARVIIASYHNWDFELIKLWRADDNKKPYIPSTLNFNISHSGNFVVVAFSIDPIGIDIEEVRTMGFESIATSFTSEEQAFLRNRNFNKTDFYKMWVKKEAYLKATGVGIVKGLDSVNVLGDCVADKVSDWHFIECPIADGYICFVCSYSNNRTISIEPLSTTIPLPIYSGNY